jgi:hypothetical protein
VTEFSFDAVDVGAYERLRPGYSEDDAGVATIAVEPSATMRTVLHASRH